MSEAASRKRGLPLQVKMRHSSHFVEDLTGRHEAPVGKQVALSSLRPNPNQPRSDVGDLSDLVQSIRDRGVLEPILVRPIGDSGEARAAGNVYEIIAGERRFRAALEAGLYEVPVIELQVSEQEALEIALVENLQRKDLSPFEEAEGYEALGSRHSYTQEQIARAVGKARSSVAESLALLAIPAELRRSAEAIGLRSKSGLLAVARARNPEAMKQLIEEAGRLGSTRDDLRRSGRRAKGGDKGRKKPYVFRFRSEDRRFSLNLTFRQSTVEKNDLILAVEQLLEELKKTDS